MTTPANSEHQYSEHQYTDNSRGADQFYADHEIAPGITRRSFMAALGLGAGVAAAPLSAVSAAPTKKAKAPKNAKAAPAKAASTSAPASGSSANGDGILVMVTLYGGNDGLNTVVPFTDPAYLAARPNVAVNPDQALRLDNNFGLHPELKGLKGLFDQKHLAVVMGVGYPEPNRSHFRSMDIWQTARPTEVTNTGWLGRWHDATGPDPLRMINIGGSMPRFMAGTKGSGANLNPGKLALPGGAAGEKLIANLGRNFENTAGLGPLGARIAASHADLVRVKSVYAPLVNTKSDTAGGGGTNLEGEGYNSLTRDLLEVAQLINAGAPARVYGASLGGFDTHASEIETHARLMSYVDQALTQFYAAVSSNARGQKVTLVVYSEFGRRVAINGSFGTDHGTAGPVLVLGPQVKGGLYGQPPSLTDLDSGDLKFTTDFRSVYSTVLGSTLGIDPSAALGGNFPALGFL
jgi:uncharacterized protein (DUF1501 family)